MRKRFAPYHKDLVIILPMLLILFGVYLISLHNYLLFHSLAEIFSIAIAYGVFMFAWNSREFSDSDYVLYLGIAYFFVGSLDLLHTLAYEGMTVFSDSGTNLAGQLWISARYLESVTLLIAPLFIGRKLDIKKVFLGYAVIMSLLLASILYWHIFPACFIEGPGLTPFKKVSEYIICLILLLAILELSRKRKEFDQNVFQYLIASIIVTIASELAFTFYITPYDFYIFIGHYFKIASFYFIYRAIIKTGLINPYRLLFRNLKNSEESLNQSRRDLEKKVKERTVKLRSISRRLLNAYEEERKIIALELHDDLGQSLSAIKFMMEDAYNNINKDNGTHSADFLKPIIPLVQRIIDDTRRIQRNLRPPMLDDLGLLPTISWFCREFEATFSEIKIIRNIDIEERDVPDSLKIVIYRIIQEAMNNIAKHSEADSARISLGISDNVIELVVSDNGKGFNPGNTAQQEYSERGLGLSSMRERAELSEGYFSIVSREGEGTTIKASWPQN